jgi:hypothetical protein
VTPNGKSLQNGIFIHSITDIYYKYELCKFSSNICKFGPSLTEKNRPAPGFIDQVITYKYRMTTFN